MRKGDNSYANVILRPYISTVVYKQFASIRKLPLYTAIL